MKYKYLIPLVLGALLVTIALPASAAEVETNPVQTQVNSNGQVVISQYPKDTVSISGASYIKWYNVWTNQHQSGTSYDIFYGYNWGSGNNNYQATSPSTYLGYHGAYSETKKTTPQIGTINKYHRYGQSMYSANIQTECKA